MGKFREKTMHFIILGINLLSILLCCCVENNEGSKNSFVLVETNNGINIVVFSIMIAILAFIYLLPLMEKASLKTKKLLGGLAYLILGVFVFSNCMALSGMSNVVVNYPVAIFNIAIIVFGIVLLCFKIPKPVASEIDNRPVTIKEHLTDESEGGVLLNNIPKTIVKKPEKLSESSNELLYWMKLYDDGLITEEEFKKIKEKLYKIAGI